jgi:hypothetical protein
MSKEKHPYIHYFSQDLKPWKYLIIGTFPPNNEVRQGNKSVTDYFYGNKGTLWKILQEIYTEFNFEKGSRTFLKDEMIKWQYKYNVGITDTLISLNRTYVKSSADNDFILDWEDYNHELRSYILENSNHIEKIYFTSSKGCNSAFETFKIIMGKEINQIPVSKLITNLPSPSGSSNTAWFNVNSEETLGLQKDFFNYIKSEKPNLLEDFKTRWNIKKDKKEKKLNTKVPSAPRGIVTEFKIWSYKNEFPEPKA